MAVFYVVADTERTRLSSLKPVARPGILKWVGSAKSVENYKDRGSGGLPSPSGVQGQSPGRGSGGRSPPEAERFL